MSTTDILSTERVIPEALARSLNAVALRWDSQERLIVGTSADIEEAALEQVVSRLRSEMGVEISAVGLEAELLSELIDTAYQPLEDFAERVGRVTVVTSDGPIAELVESVLTRAVRLRASDVHFEPGESELVVRIRVDGRLEELARFPAAAAAPIISRLKVLAQMNIVERRRPQDGQFTLELADKEIDVRLATISVMYGEKAVARLLDTRRELDDVRGLGMRGENLETFDRLIHSPYGLIAVAGPTGAGKTTTLHSAIRELNTPDQNVTTLEDPIEYVVEGVNHIPVNEGIGVTFALQLRGLLRQDPDIILVGETRDEETARIGIQAALAGRLVLTSLHATDAVSAIYRLLQMGIEPHLVAASLRGVIAQRLVRRICRYCTEEYPASPAERLLLGDLTSEANITLARGMGCAVCRGTGYSGRLGIFEILEVTDELREFISRRPNPTELTQAATRAGLRSLRDSAFLAALSRETTVMEAAALVGENA